MSDESGPLTATKYHYMTAEELETEIDCLKQDLRLFSDDYQLKVHIENELDKARAAYEGLAAIYGMKNKL